MKLEPPMSTALNELDVVALMQDRAADGLRRGQVGTVVNVLGSDAYLVEFADLNGRAYAIVELSGTELMRLHHSPSKVA